MTTRITAARSTDVVLEVERRDSNTGSSWMATTYSVGSTTYTSDQLAERDLRQVLFGEEDRSDVLSFGGRIRDFTADLPTSGVSTDLYQAVFALLLAEALVDSGRAMRVTRVLVSPPGTQGRNVSLEWVGHTNRGDQPTTRSLYGVMPVR